MTDGSLTKAALIKGGGRASRRGTPRSSSTPCSAASWKCCAVARKVELRGFGSFRLPRREPHRGRNPRTGDRVEVPSKHVAYFTPGRELKALINREVAQTGPAADVSSLGVGDDFRRVFFRWRSCASDASHPVDVGVALDELPPVGGDRRRVDAEQLGDAPVAARSPPYRHLSASRPASRRAGTRNPDVSRLGGKEDARAVGRSGYPVRHGQECGELLGLRPDRRGAGSPAARSPPARQGPALGYRRPSDALDPSSRDLRSLVDVLHDRAYEFLRPGRRAPLRDRGCGRTQAVSPVGGAGAGGGA